jgi:hypothetical protein
MISRAYIASEVCGREWDVFASRITAQPDSVDTASPIVPVIWQMVLPLPEIVSRIQWSQPSFGERYKRHGLSELMHFDQQEYRRFLEALVDHVHQTIVRHGIPPARHSIPLKGAANAFEKKSHVRAGVVVAIVVIVVALLMSVTAGVMTARKRSARDEVKQWIDSCASSTDPRFLTTAVPAAIDRLGDHDLLELADVSLRDCPAATSPFVSRALKRLPHAAEAWRLEGDRLYLASSYADALAAFDRAVALGGNGTVFHGRARAKRQLGDHQGYYDDIREACRQGDQSACVLQ